MSIQQSVKLYLGTLISFSTKWVLNSYVSSMNCGFIPICSEYHKKCLVGARRSFFCCRTDKVTVKYHFNKVVCLVGYNVLERMRFSARKINDASFRKRRQHTHNAQLESMIFPAYLTRRAPCIKIVFVGIHQLWTVLELTILAYNILRMIGQETIGRRKTRHKVHRRRLRTVISNMILMASHVTEHARQLIMGLGQSNVWRHTFAEIYTAFAVVALIRVNSIRQFLISAS